MVFIAPDKADMWPRALWLGSLAIWLGSLKENGLIPWRPLGGMVAELSHKCPWELLLCPNTQVTSWVSLQNGHFGINQYWRPGEGDNKSPTSLEKHQLPIM